MALFSDIESQFNDVFNNVNSQNVSELIKNLDVLIAKGKELTTVFNKAWQDGVAPSQDQIDLINKTSDSYTKLLKAKESLEGTMHDTYVSGDPNAIKTNIALYEQLHLKLREVISTMSSASQVGNNILTNPNKSNALAQFNGKSQQEIGAQILQNIERMKSFQRLQNQISSIGQNGAGHPEVKKGVINIGNEQPKGEILPKEQIKGQVDSLKEETKGLQEQAEKTQKAIVKIFDPQSGNYVEKEVEYKKSSMDGEAKQGEKTWEDRKKELAQMSAEERKAEFQRQREQAKESSTQGKKLTEKTWEDRKKELAQMSAEERKAEFQRQREQASYGKKEKDKSNDQLQGQVQNYEQLGAKIEELTQRATALRTVLQQPSVSGEAYSKYIEELSAVEAKLKELEREKSLIDKQQPTEKAQPIEPFKADPQSYQELVGWIDTLKSKIAELSIGVKDGTSTNFEKDQQTIAEYSNELKRLQGIKSNLDKGQGLVSNEEPAKIQGILGLLKETISTKAQLAQERAGILSSQDMESTMGNIKSLNGRLKELGAMWKAVASNSIAINALQTFGNLAKSIATTFAGALVQGFKYAINGAKQLASSIYSLASGAFNALKSAVSTTLGNMQKLVSGGFNAVKNGVNAVKTGFQSLKSHMQSIVKKGTPNLMKSFGSLKSMLMRRIKRTFISSIFNQAKEGLQQLAKSSDSFNQSMSNIKNSAKEVAGNLAITLGNLIQTIEPALQTILGFINSIFQAINGLFAMLSGKTTMMVAKKGTDDYAKSLKGASGAAKDLNHQLYGFDEITRQEDNSGGGGGGSKIGYEEQEIGEALGGINDFFKNMLEAFQNGEYERVGQLVGEQINNLVNTVDGFITSITPKAIEWSDNIARIFNGLVDGIDWANVGNLIADGLNLAFGIVNKFLTRFNFKNLGKKVALLFKGIVSNKNLNWSLIGETIANWFNMLPRFLAGLFEEMPWGDLGDRFATSIKGFFNNIDWNARNTAITKGVNGITTFLTNVIKGVEWEKIGKEIGTFLSNTINGIEWDNIGHLISLGVNKLLGAFKELVDSNFFSSLFENVGNLIGTALNGISWSSLAQTVLLGLAEIRDAFWSFIDKLNLPNLVTKIASGINGLLDNEQVKAAWDASDQKAIDGINGIIGVFNKLLSGKENGGIDFDGITKDLGDRVGKLLSGIDWQGVATIARNGIRTIATAFSNLVTRVERYHIGNKLASAINTFFDTEHGGQALADAAEKAGEGLNSIATQFTGFLAGLDLEGIRKSISRSVRAFFKNSDFSLVLSRISKFVLNVGIEFANLITEITAVDEEGKNLGDRIADAVNGLFDQEDMFSGLGTALSTSFKSVFESGTSLFEGIDTKKIASDLETFLKGIDWPGVLKAVFEFVGTFIGTAIKFIGDITAALVGWLVDLDWGQIAIAVVSGVVGIIGSILTNSLNAVGAILEKLWKKVFGEDYLNETPWDDQSEIEKHYTLNSVKENLIDRTYSDKLSSIAGFVDTIKLAEDAEEQATFVANSWVDAFGFIVTQGEGELEDQLKSYGINEDVINTLINRYRTLIDSNADGFYSALGDFGVTVSREFSDRLYDATIESEDNLAIALELMSMGVKEDMLSSLDLANIDENLQVFMARTGKNLEETAKIMMSNNKEELANIARELGIEVGDDLGSVTPEALKKALLEGKKSVQEAADELAEIASQTENKADIESGATEAGESAASGVATGEDNKKEEVETATTGITSAVQEKYEALPDEVKPYAEQLMEYIVTALSDKDGTVKSAIEAVAQSAVDRAKEILAGSVGVEIGKGFIDGIRDGINSDTSRSDSIENLINQKTNNALEYANNNMSYKTAYIIGQNMIVGLYNGFHSYSQALVDFIAHVCNVCAETARDILGIASPSKVFAEIGEYTMEGMKVGLENGGKNAINSINDITNAIIDEAENGDSIAIQVSTMTNGLDVVTSKMSRLAEIFSDIADTISSMGGLEIPTVANGQVLPYRSRVDTQPANSVSLTGSNDLEDAIYSAFSRAMGVSNGEQTVDITLQIDGRKLTDIVTKYQRQQNRAWSV